MNLLLDILLYSTRTKKVENVNEHGIRKTNVRCLGRSAILDGRHVWGDLEGCYHSRRTHTLKIFL